MKRAIVLLALVLVVGSLIIGYRRVNSGQTLARMIAERHETKSENLIAEPSRVTSQAVTDVSMGAGDYEYTVMLDEVERRYLIHVPPSYDKKQALPLVLYYHGGGGNMNHSARAYGWKETADREGFIVVFTNGDSRLPQDKFATWNAGNCCGYARDAKIDDVGYTKLVIKDIESKFLIDANRIFATGMSNGGIMSYRLACEMAETFRAVASVAGTDGMATCTPIQPISVLHIHAKDDDHVLIGGGAGSEAFRDLDTVADFLSVDDTIARWVKRNNMNPTPERVLKVSGAYCDLYTSAENSAQVKLCVTETGGHSWPGSRAARGKSPSRAIIANDVIWDFFKNQK